jgi:hypothetical protein
VQADKPPRQVETPGAGVVPISNWMVPALVTASGSSLFPMEWLLGPFLSDQALDGAPTLAG